MPIELPKYIRRILDNVKYPTLLVLHEKHDRDYYLCEDEAALGRACLDVLAARADPKYGYITSPPKEPVGLMSEVSGDIDAVPAIYQDQEKRARASNLSVRHRHAERVREYKQVKDALAEMDGLGAYMILHFLRVDVRAALEIRRPLGVLSQEELVDEYIWCEARLAEEHTFFETCRLRGRLAGIEYALRGVRGVR
jgi:hypothetical protein